MIDEVPGFAHKLLSGLAHRLREYDVKSGSNRPRPTVGA